jgi:hypothetical protein
MENVDSKIGLMNLADEHKLGCTIAWNVPANLCVATADVEKALTDRGLPNYKPAGCTPLVRWKELVKNHLVSRASSERPMRSNECRHPDKDVTSYEFSVNIISSETEKARLAPVGTMSFRKVNDAMWWRFTCGARLQGETLADYVDRNLEHDPSLTRSDCLDFAAFADRAIEDAARFDGCSAHSASTLKQAIKVGFESSGGFSVASRGGFWFLPRLDGATCPYGVGHKIAAAMSEATGNSVRFTTMHVPKDATSIQGASEVAREDFLETLASLETEVSELEFLREGQNDVRRKRVSEIMAQVQIYKTVWGMAGDDLTSIGDRVLTMMDAHDAKTAAKKASKKAPKAKPSAASVVVSVSEADSSKESEESEEAYDDDNDLTPEEEAEIEAEIEAEAEAQIEVPDTLQDKIDEDLRKVTAIMDAQRAVEKANLGYLLDTDEVRSSIKKTGKAVVETRGFSIVIRYDDGFGATWRLLRDKQTVCSGAKATLDLETLSKEIVSKMEEAAAKL